MDVVGFAVGSTHRDPLRAALAPHLGSRELFR
jgi:hypothetical protein